MIEGCYKHLFNMVLFIHRLDVLCMCTCKTYWKTHKNSIYKVFTVPSMWHNSGHLDFLLFIFGDHILFLYWKKILWIENLYSLNSDSKIFTLFSSIFSSPTFKISFPKGSWSPGPSFYKWGFSGCWSVKRLAQDLAFY